MTSQDLPESAQRVQTFLSSKGLASKVYLLSESTATALDAAAALDVPVYKIGKSIVFAADEAVIVVILCGDQRVDLDALSRVTGIDRLVRLKANMVRERTGYPIGGVSPFALPNGVKVIVDSRLHSFEQFFVAAGHPNTVVLTGGNELVGCTQALVETIAVNL